MVKAFKELQGQGFLLECRKESFNKICHSFWVASSFWVEMMRVILIAVMLLMLSSVTATSAPKTYTGRQLQKDCLHFLNTTRRKNDPNGKYDQASMRSMIEGVHCAGFVHGAWTHATWVQRTLRETIPELTGWHCEVGQHKLVEVVVLSLEWLEKHPEQLDDRAISIVERAMANAWPCKK